MTGATVGSARHRGLRAPRGRIGPVLAAGTALAVSTALARAERVGEGEAVVFRAVNGLPDALRVPVWLVMQLGSFGGVPLSVAAALVARRPALAARLAVAGSAAYLLPKPWKRMARRERPDGLLDGVVRRDDSTGLGYPSGHTAVATALALTAAAHLPRGSGAVLAPLVGLVAVGRVYVGAHLPLDLVGGAAIGSLVAWAVEAVGARPQSLTGRVCGG